MEVQDVPQACSRRGGNGVGSGSGSSSVSWDRRRRETRDGSSSRSRGGNGSDSAGGDSSCVWKLMPVEEPSAAPAERHGSGPAAALQGGSGQEGAALPTVFTISQVRVPSVWDMCLRVF